MRLLLDTHAMYWYVEGDPQLSAVVQMLIQDASNEILISPASYWEIAIKISIGKWKLRRSYEDFIDIGLNNYGFQVLPILPSTRRGWSDCRFTTEIRSTGSSLPKPSSRAFRS